MPVRRHIPMAALLSAQTSRRAVKPRSWAIAVKPRPSAAPFTMPASSASPELRAMAPHAHASANRPPSVEAPGKVGVDECAE
eukprot:3983821-Alexandrium_andersonii.AAC.1